MAFYQQIQGLAQWLLPARAPDTTVINGRFDGYGGQAVNTFFNKKQALAGEGSYFVTTNPTPGTGVGAGPVVTSYANTAPYFILQNNNPAGGPVIYPDYLKLIVSAAFGGGTVTNWNFAVIRDVAVPLSLYVTTATSLSTATPNNVNALSPVRSNAVFGFQGGATALVAKAPSASSAIVGRASVGAGIGLVGEEVVLDFGALDPCAYQGLTAAEAVSPGRKVSVLPPLAIAPGQQIAIVAWFPTATTTGLNYEFELGHVER
jgi:hypothetical protein